ncbi:hypothetical protein [Enterococcus avium]|uniref:hypothetical protein n=1 Tax=Enterococcus avium TaxID=33945 RepID=UPI00288E9C28|nr:hypothetical protein [Enterococcus avium]MDT2437423.1 hypothetical protein [Enterococcus avium]
MTQYTDRKNALKTLKTIDENKNEYLIIHYACERFNKETGESPRISSIAIRNFYTGQTTLFALHKTAESMGVKFNEINHSYDKLEKQMLKEYFKYIKDNPKKNWIHWNMRDTNYGFKALEHRYKVLGGKPVEIDDDRKIDLSGLFVDLYGKGYASHPRLESLMEKNHIDTPRDFLTGIQETEKFDEQRFNEIMMSTSRKVDIFSNFLNLAINSKLNVYTRRREWYGTTLKGWWANFRNSAWFVPVSWTLSAIGGALISHIIDQWLK